MIFHTSCTEICTHLYELVHCLLQEIANTLKVWENLNLCRSVGAIAGWILTAFYTDEDMLYLYLRNMLIYQRVTASAPARY
jgi:hypothetical protein